MATLICTLLTADEAAALLPPLRALQETGTAIVLWAPQLQPQRAREAGWVEVSDATELERAWESEQPALAAGDASAGAPPAWLPATDLERVLLVGREPVTADCLPAAEAAVAATLLAAGCEAVERITAGEAEELHQSWTSGRRVGVRLVTHP